jgi:hypothetical protein
VICVALSFLAGGFVLGLGLGLHLARRRAADDRVGAVEEAFTRGKRVGADDLIDQMIRHAFEREDAIESGWPATRRGSGRPS